MTAVTAMDVPGANTSDGGFFSFWDCDYVIISGHWRQFYGLYDV
jgi:hypothetical protein